MAVKRETVRTGLREFWGILLLGFFVLALLSVASYTPDDVPLVQSPPNTPAQNFIGPLGAWLSYVLFMALGVGGYLAPLVLMGTGLYLVFKREGRIWPKVIWMLVALLSLMCLFELSPRTWSGLSTALNAGSPGGTVGHLLVEGFLARFLGVMGAAIVAIAFFLASLVLLIEVHPVQIARQIGLLAGIVYRKAEAFIVEHRDKRAQLEHERREVEKRRQRLERVMKEQEAAKEAEKAKPPQRPAIGPAVVISKDGAVRSVPEPRRTERRETEEEPVPQRPAPPPPRPPSPPPAPRKPAPARDEPRPPAPEPGHPQYALPSMDLLDPLPPAKDREIHGDAEGGAQVLKDTLAEFGIEVDITNVQHGPVVTRYELLPAPGVRVEKIGGLSNNIALAMKAESIRVQAPIPGKGVVGIEVPNTGRSMVFLREVMESPAWQAGKAAIPIALGKDVSGRVLVPDLAEMPHLLIGGATGSGKTVCMNSILVGLLMSRTPDQLRLMLIDPKIVEFSSYNQLPHLVAPVITDAKKVSIGLRWAINEMEKRYSLFAKVGVRNIHSYNTRPIVRQAELFSGDPEAKPADEPPARLPYIVIVVDELADLMLVAQAEIENQIARLAQLSRATGIHMILATQRPSVNVITGTIKANFPARIAFQVAQKVDSRTILDAAGADKLLGKGDLLFLPPGSSKLMRAQGTLTSDAEIRRVVDFLKNQGTPQYINDIREKIESKSPDLPELEEDDLLEAAIEVIRQTRRASTSSLQRRLRIGYTRAARLIDLLEERGVVGPPKGSDPREILIDLDGGIPQNPADEDVDDEEPRM